MGEGEGGRSLRVPPPFPPGLGIHAPSSRFLFLATPPLPPNSCPSQVYVQQHVLVPSQRICSVQMVSDGPAWQVEVGLWASEVSRLIRTNARRAARASTDGSRRRRAMAERPSVCACMCAYVEEGDGWRTREWRGWEGEARSWRYRGWKARTAEQGPERRRAVNELGGGLCLCVCL